MPENETYLPYFLQYEGIDYDDLQNLDFGLAIVDQGSIELTAAQLDALEAQGKEIGAYLSIGELDPNRGDVPQAWRQEKPDFAFDENTEWGSYRVDVTSQEWKDFVIGRAQEYAALGYDVLFLDVVDAYDVTPNSAADMAALIEEISEAVPGVRIIANNAQELVMSQQPQLQDHVDGLLRENMWYWPDGSEIDANPGDAAWMANQRAYMQQAQELGIQVFVTDYIADNPELSEQYASQALEEGFLPYVGPSDLILSHIPELNYAMWADMPGVEHLALWADEPIPAASLSYDEVTDVLRELAGWNVTEERLAELGVSVSNDVSISTVFAGVEIGSPEFFEIITDLGREGQAEGIEHFENRDSGGSELGQLSSPDTPVAATPSSGIQLG